MTAFFHNLATQYFNFALAFNAPKPTQVKDIIYNTQSSFNGHAECFVCVKRTVYLNYCNCSGYSARLPRHNKLQIEEKLLVRK
jgi:hypothetical protein